MNLAQILQTDKHCQQVYFSQRADTRIEVIKSKKHMWLTINHVVQSAIELSPPYRPALPHCMVMLLPLIHDRVPEQVLELGGGAQSIQRYLTHSQPNVQFTSVESNPDVIKLTREVFPSGADLNIVETDAFEYVHQCAKQNQTFDWIIVDLFHGADSSINAGHISFFDKVHQCLNNDGWLILNCLYPEHEKRDKLVNQVAQTFSHSPYMFAVPQMQNHILLINKQETFHFPEEIEQHNLT